MLAVMHQQGLGVAVNYKRAPIAHLRTTKLGDTTVLYNLAEFHQLGNGVALNDAATRKWHLAATQGHPKTQNNLGATYYIGAGYIGAGYIGAGYIGAGYIGAGVAQDLVEAWKWLTLAANRLRDQYRTVTLSNRTHALRKI
jgi:TPR repeat protein